MIRIDKSKIDQAISSKVKFGFLKFGSLCNASESNTFTLARCQLTKIKGEEKLYSVDLEVLFNRGIELLKKYSDHTSTQPEATEIEAEAILKLEKFFEIKGKVMHRYNFY